MYNNNLNFSFFTYSLIPKKYLIHADVLLNGCASVHCCIHVLRCHAMDGIATVMHPNVENMICALLHACSVHVM